MRLQIGAAMEPATSGGLEEAEKKLRSRRNALLCALLVGVCWVATYPVAKMGFIDDWSYAKTALDFAHISWFILVIFAAYSLAATHDWFAVSRARVFAANEVAASGVPRTAIQGGFEYDAWTQIENGRYINEAFIGVPRGAYHPTALQPLPPGCQDLFSRYKGSQNGYWFSDYTPSVKPKYFLAFERIPCLASSKYPAVSYRRWFPPIGQKVYIMQLPEKSQ